MLPFLDDAKRKAAATIIAKRKPSGEIEDVKEEGGHSEELMACAEDLIAAVHAKDAKGVASAMEAAFHVLESEPHMEGPSIPEDAI